MGPPLVPLILAVFATFSAMFGLFPILTPLSRDLGADLVLAGWIVGIYSATNLVGNAVAGVLIQRWGGLPVLRTGLWLTALAVALHAAAVTPPPLLALRALHGFAAAWTVPAAFALAAGRLPPKERGRGLGRLGAPIGLAAVVAPPLAGVLASMVDVRLVFLLWGAVAAAAALVVNRGFGRDTTRPAAGDGRGEMPGHGRMGDSGGGLGETLLALLRRRSLWHAWLAGFALPFNLGLLAWYLPEAASARGLGGQAVGGAALGLMALVAGLVMMGPGGRWADRFDRRRLIAAGLAVTGTAMAGWAVPAPPWAFFLAAAVFGCGFGLIFPAATALVPEAAPAGGEGMAFAVFYAWFSVGTAVAPPLTAWLEQVAGWPPFAVGAVIAWLAGAIRSPRCSVGKENRRDDGPA